MKLLGRSIDGKRLVEEVRARLRARGIHDDVPDAPLEDEAPVEPLGYLVQALEENADPAQPPPLASSPARLRGLLRYAARGVLEELFGRQRAFNVHVRDFAAQLSTEVLALRARVTELERMARPATRQLPRKQPKPTKRVTNSKRTGR